MTGLLWFSLLWEFDHEINKMRTDDDGDSLSEGTRELFLKMRGIAEVLERVLWEGSRFFLLGVSLRQ